MDWEQDPDVVFLQPLAKHTARTLGEEARRRLQNLTHRARGIYNDPLRYEDMYNTLLKLFPGPHKLQTVGAKLVGCSQPTSLQPRGCHAICAGALPLPRDSAEVNSHCSDMVVVATQGDAGLAIDVLQGGRGVPAKLFVAAPHFTGFDFTERERLEDLAPRYDVYLGLDATEPTWRDVPAGKLVNRKAQPTTLTLTGVLVLVLLGTAVTLALVLGVQLSGRQNRISLPV